MLLFLKTSKRELLKERIWIIKLQKKIPLLSGVRQKDPISPNLFTQQIRRSLKFPTRREKKKCRWRKTV